MWVEIRYCSWYYLHLQNAIYLMPLPPSLSRSLSSPSPSLFGKSVRRQVSSNNAATKLLYPEPASHFFVWSTHSKSIKYPNPSSYSIYFLLISYPQWVLHSMVFRHLFYPAFLIHHHCNLPFPFIHNICHHSYTIHNFPKLSSLKRPHFIQSFFFANGIFHS